MNSMHGKEDRKGDGKRRIIAAITAIVCLVVAGLLLTFSICGRDPTTGALLQAVVAVALSAAVVYGARALDGPIRARSRHRQDLPQSQDEGAVRLWIACFMVIEASFLLATLAGALYERNYRTDRGASFKICQLVAPGPVAGTLNDSDKTSASTLNAPAARTPQ